MDGHYRSFKLRYTDEEIRKMSDYKRICCLQYTYDVIRGSAYHMGEVRFTAICTRSHMKRFDYILYQPCKVSDKGFRITLVDNN